jgi:DNA polymerase I-like protein with 3'-5' exonuclease and polymerase domains
MQIQGYDIETTGLNPFKDMLVTHQFGNAFVEDHDITEKHTKTLQDKEVKKIIHNAAFELPWVLYHRGIEIVNFEDTMLMAKYLNISAHVTTSKLGKPLKNSFYSIALKPLYENILGGDTSFAKEVGRLGGIDKITRYLYLDEELVKGKGLTREYVYDLFKAYAIADNTMSEALYNYFISLPKWKEVRGIYELNKSVLMDFAKMRVRGIPVDKRKLAEFKEEVTRDYETAEKKLFDITGIFNYDSDEEASAKLKECGVPLTRKNYNGFYFTNKDVLAPYRKDFPVVDYFIEARSKAHDMSYCESLEQKWMSGDGYVHPDVNIEGSKHGRLACADPNLMNLKRDGKLRGLFGAEPGYDVYFFDWAQHELVGLAYTMGIKTMLDRINNDIDLHRAFAPRIYRKSMEEINDDERNIAKTGNFQLGYMSGIAKFTTTLNEKANVPIEEAKRLAPIVHKAFHDEYPEIKDHTYFRMKEVLYSDEELQQMHDDFMKVREKQGLSTWTFRGRKYRDIKHRGFLKNVFGRHVVPENPSKAYTCGELVVSGGFTGDMIKWKVRTVNRYIKKKGYDAHVGMTVHDELIMHIKPKCANELVPWIKECMEFFPKVTKVVKIKCDVEKSADGSWSKKGRQMIYDSKIGEWYGDFKKED